MMRRVLHQDRQVFGMRPDEPGTKGCKQEAGVGVGWVRNVVIVWG